MFVNAAILQLKFKWLAKSYGVYPASLGENCLNTKHSEGAQRNFTVHRFVTEANHSVGERGR